MAFVTVPTDIPFKRPSEVWTREQEIAAGIDNRFDNDRHALLSDEAVPASLNWCDKDGVNYCTMNRNQHIPQYCGSCWAHGAVSALGDRVKIARGAKGVDINLSVQHILNCGNVGSCHGGSIVGAYQWIHQISQGTGVGISYETSNSYIACSSESKEGFCADVDTTCTPMNVARTCSTFTSNGGKCVSLSQYPNVTVSDYGTISGQAAMQKEILINGPIACGIDAAPILKYTGGISSLPGDAVDHVVSVVGWGVEGSTSYWIVRNSWGEYWGEMGYIRVAFGALLLEESCSWATVQNFTETNFPCYEGGSNCL